MASATVEVARALAASVEAQPWAWNAFKVYAPGNPDLCVALLLPSNRLVFRRANPDDPYQQWEIIVDSDNRSELVNIGSGKSIKNVHILLPDLVESAYFHPRMLRPTAQFEQRAAGGGDVGDGGMDIVCVSVLSNYQLALKIAPWGHDQQVKTIETRAQAADEMQVAASDGVLEPQQGRDVVGFESNPARDFAGSDT